MKNIRYTIATLLVIVLSHTAVAQTALSSYFLDGAFYNSKLNPAMQAERAYFSFGLGDFSLSSRGNVGLSNFLYPRGENELATFMSGSVSADEFLAGIPDNTKLGVNLDETIMAFGFRMLGGYFSFDLSLHSSTDVSLPKGLFEFAKNGLKKEHYGFSGLNVNTMNYAAATVGYSREIFKGLRVGANAKYLLGLAHADLYVDKLDVELSGQRWLVESHAQAQAALFCEADILMDENNIINGLEMADFRASSGFAVDLGVVYDMAKFVPGLKLSASVVDLGFINWRYMMKGQSADAKAEFNGFGEIDYNDVEGGVSAELERFADDVTKLLEFEYDGATSSVTGLNTTMHIGAEYNMPFYKPLSVGVLYTQCMSPFAARKWGEGRGYLNVSPLKWIDLSVNYAYGTYGHSFGWMVNFHPAGINFFVGSDCMITKVSPQYIPLNNMNSHVTFGLSLAFGERK